MPFYRHSLIYYPLYLSLFSRYLHHMDHTSPVSTYPICRHIRILSLSIFLHFPPRFEHSLQSGIIDLSALSHADCYLMYRHKLFEVFHSPPPPPALLAGYALLLLPIEFVHDPAIILKAHYEQACAHAFVHVMITGRRHYSRLVNRMNRKRFSGEWIAVRCTAKRTKRQWSPHIRVSHSCFNLARAGSTGRKNQRTITQFKQKIQPKRAREKPTITAI